MSGLMKHADGLHRLWAGAAAALALGLASPAQAVPVNLALASTATQSSTFPGGEAFKAIDGDTNGSFGPSVAHTGNDGLSGFWQVELTGDFVIDNVVVWNRTDCCGARLRSIRLSVFDDLTEVFGVDLFTALGTFAPTTFSVDAGDVQGDRVRIAYIDTENLPDDAFLTLAEVQVFETERRQTPQAPEPAALALFALGLAGLGLGRVRTAA